MCESELICSRQKAIFADCLSNQDTKWDKPHIFHINNLYLSTTKEGKHTHKHTWICSLYSKYMSHLICTWNRPLCSCYNLSCIHFTALHCCRHMLPLLTTQQILNYKCSLSRNINVFNNSWIKLQMSYMKGIHRSPWGGCSHAV